MGSLDWPFNPVALALGAEASFVGRSIDTDREHLTEVLRRAAKHQGAAFVEIYQNCNVFNDGAFDAVRRATSENRIRLEHGKPIPFGAEDERGVPRPDGSAELVEVAEAGEERSRARRASRVAEPGLRAGPPFARRRTARRRSASSATSSGRSTTA